MNTARKLIGQTFVYGLATVLPRMMSFLLVPLYTSLLKVSVYGVISIVFSWMVLFNVVLSYGMETAVFRFFHKENENKKVIATALYSLIFSSLFFLFVGLFFAEDIAQITHINSEYLKLAIGILVLDALVVVPFATLRIRQKAVQYTWIKISNVLLNLTLNILFLWLFPAYQITHLIGFSVVFDDPIIAIFTANLIASSFTLLWLMQTFGVLAKGFDGVLLKQMLRYAYPILIAGLAFAVNETFDRILLARLLPKDIAAQAVGAYAACYKLAMFVTLFATAFRLGIEPFFFSKAKDANAPETYATITHYFTVFGSIVVLAVVVFSDFLKTILIRDSAYWEAMKVVPLLLFANLFLGIYHNLSVAYKVTDKTLVGAGISVFGAVVTLGINFWLIPSMSYMGSAIATFAAYGSMMLLSLYLGRKYMIIPYHFKKSGLYLFLSGIFTILSFYIFDHKVWVGGLLLVVFLFFVWKLEQHPLKKLLLTTTTKSKT
ncbi:MAG: oligosaccharide flippase family protein [Flavobacteriaceae bacterium]|nr:oligosaccharide flippase family protein [Flavobacteriaceae bacterium]